LTTQRIKVRGLPRIVAWILGVWGAAVTPKAVYDLFWGEPEANLYAPAPWAFVNKEQWLRYGGFELAYGLSLLTLAYFLYRYSRFLPETVVREAEE
jgi:hypothetical protein